MAVGDKLPVVMGAEKGVPGGIATLGADGKLEPDQAPDFSGEYQGLYPINILASNTDLNTMITPGMWGTNSSAGTSTLQNCPISTGYITLIVKHAYPTNTLLQEVYSWPNSTAFSKFWRSKYGDSDWTEWIEEYTPVLDYYGASASPDIDTVLDDLMLISAEYSKNCPVTGGYVLIQQFFFSSVSATSARIQIAYAFPVSSSASSIPKGMAIRRYSNGAWAEWEKIYSSGNKPTASDVGAIPTTEKGTASGVATLGEDGKVPAGQLPDMDYVPTTRTVNDKALSSDISLTADDVGAVPTARTVNGKALSSDITLYGSDINVSTGGAKMDDALNAKADTDLGNLDDLALALYNIGTSGRGNLLDNWYFLDVGSQEGGGHFPINQKGQTTYTTTANYMPIIDRWLSYQIGSQVTLEADGSGLDTISPSGSSGSYMSLIQRLELPLGYVLGKTMTLSAVVNDELETVTAQIPYSVTSDQVFMSQSFGGGMGAIVFRYTVSNGLFVELRTTTGNTNSWGAVKLEFGSEQTLRATAEDSEYYLLDLPINFQQELEKCQRYDMIFSGNGTAIGYGIAQTADTVFCEIPTPVTMRTAPAITQADVGLFGAGGLYVTSALAVTNISTTLLSTNGVGCVATTSGATPGAAYILIFKSADGSLELSAQL